MILQLFLGIIHFIINVIMLIPRLLLKITVVSKQPLWP